MHLVGFTIEIYYDAWPYERQICHHTFGPTFMLLHISRILLPNHYLQSLLFLFLLITPARALSTYPLRFNLP